MTTFACRHCGASIELTPLMICPGCQLSWERLPDSHGTPCVRLYKPKKKGT